MKLSDERLDAALTLLALEERRPDEEMSSFGLDWDDLTTVLATFLRGAWDEDSPLGDNAMALFTTGISLGLHYERLRHELDGDTAPREGYALPFTFSEAFTLKDALRLLAYAAEEDAESVALYCHKERATAEEADALAERVETLIDAEKRAKRDEIRRMIAEGEARREQFNGSDEDLRE